jgi:hypothetical protein
MFTYIFIAVLLTAWICLAYDIARDPLYEEEEDNITTKHWCDDHHPDQPI